MVTEIEHIIDTKIDEKKDTLATKADIMHLQLDIEKRFNQPQVEIERRFNQLIIWIVATFIAFSGIVIVVIKL